jgi:hypothetical protein
MFHERRDAERHGIRFLNRRIFFRFDGPFLFHPLLRLPVRLSDAGRNFNGKEASLFSLV